MFRSSTLYEESFTGIEKERLLLVLEILYLVSQYSKSHGLITFVETWVYLNMSGQL